MRHLRYMYYQSSKKRIVYFALAFIILFSITVTTYIRLGSYPIQSIISWDIVPNLIQSQRFINEHKVEQINFFPWTTEWIYDPKPVGFPILAAEFSLLGNISLYYVGFFSVLYYFLDILLVFLLSYKTLLKNKKGAILSSFLMATYLTGPINQGPLHSHYANLDFIFFLSIIITLISIKTLYKKFIISSTMFGAIFITHRPGLIFVFLFGITLILYSTLYFIIKRNFHLWKNMTIPYIASFIFGWDIAYVYWSNIKLENILLFGFSIRDVRQGSLPEFLIEIISSINYSTYLIGLVGINILVIFITILCIKYKKNDLPIIKPFISINKFLFIVLALIIPISLLGSLIYLGEQLMINFSGNIFEYFIKLWQVLSAETYTNSTARIIKQVFYLWHWNIIALILLIPSLYVTLRNIGSKYKHIELFSFVVIFILPVIILTQIYWSYTTVAERLYFYLAPFVYILIALAIIVFFSTPIPKKYKMLLKTIFIVLLLLNGSIFVSYSIVSKEPQYTNKHIECFTYIKNAIPSYPKIVGEKHDNALGNFYDSLRYMNIYPWFGTIPQTRVLDIAKIRGISYIYSNKKPRVYMNLEYIDFDNYCWKIYSTSDMSLYYIEY